MAKSSKETMTRRGVKYTIIRKADGTIGKFIPMGKSAAGKKASKKTSGRKVSAKTSSRKVSSGRTHSKSVGKRSSR